MEFTENLRKNLLAYGYRETERATGDGPAFTQNDGGIFYIVNIFPRGAAENEGAGAPRTAVHPRALEYCKSVFIINIYLLGGGADAFLKRIESAEAYDNQQVYAIDWGVELTDGGYNFFHNKRQPDKILNLRALIDKSAGASTKEGPAAEPGPLVPAAAPVLIYVVMAACGVYLAFIEMNGGSNDIQTLLTFGALYKPLVIYNGEYYRLFSAMFIHIGLTHLLSNALGMYIVGVRVEKYFGPLKFLIIYFISGLFGNLMCLLLTEGVLAGASGAVFGTQGALLALVLKTGKPVDGFTKLFILIFATAGLCFSAMFPNVANYAHFGGFFIGFGLGWAFAPKE